MSNTKEIKARLSSVRETQKITNAMYLIASAKMRKAKEELDRTRPFFNAMGGEIKRIEIATVIARHTRLSVFDEPEAGIDLWSFSNLIGVFEKLRGKLNGSMVIISHQERILNIADRVIVLADGQVKQDGKREQILPELLAAPTVCSALADKIQ